jgi:hypothetical protein
MDRTASFLLAKLPAVLNTRISSLRDSGGRLAAPRADLPAPGDVILGAYLMTYALFPEVIGKGYETGAKAGEHYLEKTSKVGCEPNCGLEKAGKDGCPCKGTVGGEPTVDHVKIGDNKATITTTTTMTLAWGGGGKVSLDIVVNVTGEVFDANGVFLYRIQNEATGHADGDVCPDASGIAQAHLKFSGREDYFYANGTKSGKGVVEGFGGDVRITANDNATLAGVEISSSGALAAGVLGGALAHELVRLTAAGAAPAFAKAWRSGICIEVLVDPKGGDVEKDSETTVTAKVKHKIDGGELDKPVEATLSGVKSIDPAGRKQKAPATVKYKAGSKEGDRGTIEFESVSNRGIGRTAVTFCVSCADWTISSTGTAVETYASGATNNLRVVLSDIRVKAGSGAALSGTGTMTLSGVSTSVLGPATCTGKIAELTVPVEVRGTLVGTGPTAVLRLTLVTPENPNSMVAMTCSVPGGSFTTPATPQAHIGFYRQTLGEFDLPAPGGTKTVTGSVTFGVLKVNGSATFTVISAKS